MHDFPGYLFLGVETCPVWRSVRYSLTLGVAAPLFRNTHYFDPRHNCLETLRWDYCRVKKILMCKKHNRAIVDTKQHLVLLQYVMLLFNNTRPRFSAR
jgi:hypothetical protein